MISTVWSNNSYFHSFLFVWNFLCTLPCDLLGVSIKVFLTWTCIDLLWNLLFFEKLLNLIFKSWWFFASPVQKIRAYVLSDKDNRPLIIHGASGSGKTSVMAMAARQARDWIGEDCCVVLRWVLFSFGFHLKVVVLWFFKNWPIVAVLLQNFDLFKDWKTKAILILLFLANHKSPRV